MLSKVFKAYDIRNTYPDPLNEELAVQIGSAAGRYLRAKLEGRDASDPMLEHVVVGRDMRKSAPSMAQALIKGLTHAPVNVIDLGMVDTSFIYFAINHLGCAGGIQTTASHNPPQYIGFKISGLKAVPIGQDTGLTDIKEIAATVDPAAEPETIGRVEQRDLWDAYKQHVRKFLDLRRPLKVVVDASNGMAGKFMPLLFDDVEGLEIVPINYETTGEFVHDPNPLVAANMRQVMDGVAEHGADLGVCFDGDADRCAFVDENGDMVSADIFGAVMAEHFLQTTPGSAIVFDLRSSKALAEHVIACGGKPVRSRVGHVFMKALMKEHDAVFGTELSAHVYYRDNFYADSGAITFATALSIISEQDKPLSELLKPHLKYVQSGETNFEVADKQAAMDELAEVFGEGAAVDTLDGVTVDAMDSRGWWFNVRASNTEPLLRLNMEARDRATLDEMFNAVADMLGEPVAGH